MSVGGWCSTTLAVAPLLAWPALAQEPSSSEVPLTDHAVSQPAQLASPNQLHVDGTFEAAVDRDRYRVNLRRGNDYAVGAHSPEAHATVTVRAPSGAKVVSFFAGTDSSFGREFRARVSGRFTIEIRETRPLNGYPAHYGLDFSPDCRKGPSTQCRLRLDVQQQRQTTFEGDDDWFKLASIRVSGSYALEWKGETVGALQIVRRNGSVVAEQFLDSELVLPFTAPVRELYAVVREDAGDITGPYTLKLVAR